jgi:hypothetical protein
LKAWPADARLEVAELRIRELEPADAARWDAFVSACPEATFFHRAGWKSVIEQAFGTRRIFLYAESATGIEGVLPLAEVKSLLFGHTLASLPFCVYGGVAAASEPARRALTEAARALAQKLGCRSPGIPLGVPAQSRLGAEGPLRHLSQGDRPGRGEEPPRDPAQAACHGAQGHQERAW